jgi:hypothetical protein
MHLTKISLLYSYRHYVTFIDRKTFCPSILSGDQASIFLSYKAALQGEGGLKKKEKMALLLVMSLME